MSPAVSWEHFAHDADIGVRGHGPTEAIAFEQAGLALMTVVTDPSQVRPEQGMPITCAAPDDAILLVDWLNVLAMAEQGLLFGRFEVRIARHELAATAWSEPLDPERHASAVEVKGATMTSLRVTRELGGAMRHRRVSPLPGSRGDFPWTSLVSGLWTRPLGSSSLRTACVCRR